MISSLHTNISERKEPQKEVNSRWNLPLRTAPIHLGITAVLQGTEVVPSILEIITTLPLCIRAASVASVSSCNPRLTLMMFRSGATPSVTGLRVPPVLEDSSL